MTERLPDEEWQPATSEPGQVYTPEGQIKAVGAFMRGLHDPNPRVAVYRRAGIRMGLMVMAGGIALVALIAVVDALLH
jgi:hypothetical protein